MMLLKTLTHLISILYDSFFFLCKIHDCSRRPSDPTIITFVASKNINVIYC